MCPYAAIAMYGDHITRLSACVKLPVSLNFGAMNMILTKTLTTEAATQQMAAQLAPYLVAGDVIALSGDLGMGKSVFARSILRALGCREAHIPSPTFTLVQTYMDTRLPTAHVDLYRLEDPQEIDALDLGDFLNHGVTLVEWPEKAPQVLPANTLHISFKAVDDTTRTLTFSGKGWEKRIAFAERSLARPVTPEGRLDYARAATGEAIDDVAIVAADASFRSYWRIQTSQGSRILMDAPPPLEDVVPFAQVSAYLNSVGIHAPAVYHTDTVKGYALLEDFGDTTMFEAMKRGDNMTALYEKAVDILIHLAKQKPADVPAFSTQMYQDEVSLYADWYLPVVHGGATEPALRQQLRDMWLPLIAKINKTPKTTIMGDYHCQNLMVLPNGLDDTLACMGVLDFQGARVGTVAYDMVSLLYDVRFDVPADLRGHLIRRYVEGLDGAVTMEAFMTALRLSGVQNLMRIAGIFTRLQHRDGKAAYGRYMPRLWGHLSELLAHPDCASVREFLGRYGPAELETA